MLPRTTAVVIGHSTGEASATTPDVPRDAGGGMKRYVLAFITAIGLLAGPTAVVGLAEATAERRHDPWRQWRPEQQWHRHHRDHHVHWKTHAPAARPVWQPGYWYWNGWAWVWVPGYWIQ
jgi:hypothetical protein